MKNVNYMLKLFNEYIGFPIALLIYFITPSLIRLIDPEAGAFDPGQLAILSFAIIKVIVASSIAWLGYRLNFPKMYKYFMESMENDFVVNSLSCSDPYLKRKLVCVCLSLAVYFFYMLLAIVALQTV